MNFKKAIIGTMIILWAFNANAHDFSATVDGQCLYFDITSETKRTAAVTYNGNINEKIENNIFGKVEIPSRVKYEDVIYTVTSINPKAFSGAKNLKGIIIPSGVVSIGDFAFEGCDSLTNVVFPGNPVNIGQGIFFNCPSISTVTIGSDWKSIDFTMFRWSDKLTRIDIPAKIQKIQGVKKLKNLKEIYVDSNNEKFSSCDGMLYSKDGKILYACPRAFEGKAIIKEGTETVNAGALIDCANIILLDFPTSLTNLSFRETSRMKRLETIVMRPIAPITTGYFNGQGVFLLQLANRNVIIEILSSSKKAYETYMAYVAGEYSVTSSSIPYVVTLQQMPDKKNLKGVKTFKNL